ncbi:hypothetical protein A6M27_19885 [Acidithiobacillus thiooxidans]|uniref:Uncharacterized protein n=1 Tax=Acidithiobacillus thiooxidans TaxID=930 RepID=A0A1C2INM7_ACITH|nr:hypothetical protein [Acidithiobacillus thiooxidans]OCX69618.1 hypothetical protein A6O24_18045 [Acidithiobacillus thiooxidans]OCX72596.1 hypothetical protein A6P07_09515 [Acidithiobacillus thiooxidans]OCX77524.1 hypothetical protein A6O26_19875 [Acidithiobacillus thiooxidans]OCX81224.1 hypothetical protein A6M27_19885 [Acidithiobacillus thiooxidans]OFC43277.1 hypothetical protein BAE47_13215 [Acidithiobacillus thiooxidans]
MTDLETRRSQMREGARTYRARQAEKGLFQSVFWMTLAQAAAARRWLGSGGDVSVFSRSSNQSYGHQEDQ